MQTVTQYAAELHRGTPSMADYTPAGATAAGAIVNLNSRACVVHLPIAAGELGAISVPDGSAAYRVKLHTGGSYAVGDQVLVDVTPQTTAAAGIHFGYCEVAADQAAGDNYVVATLVDKASA